MNMTRTRITLVALGITALTGPALALDKDSLVGTWTLDAAKSTYDPPAPLQKFVTVVTAAGDGKYTYQSDWVEPDGSPGHLTFTSAMDGKPVPVTGYDVVDSVRCTRVNTRTVKAVFTKHGQVVERETQTLSADGNTVHDLDTGKDEHGKPFTDHLVLHRQ